MKPSHPFVFMMVNPDGWLTVVTQENGRRHALDIGPRTPPLMSSARIWGCAVIIRPKLTHAPIGAISP